MTTLSTIGRTEPRSRTDKADNTTGAVDAASYIADLSGGLAKTARDHGFPVLAHILEMAREEATAIKNASLPG